MNIENLQSKLRGVSGHLNTLAKGIRTDHPRDERNLAIYNLVNSTSLQVELLARYLGDPVQVIAFVCRNLYEVNLIIRCIFDSPNKAREWLFEMGFDEREALQGFISTAPPAAVEPVNTLKERLAEIEGVMLRAGVAPARSPTTRALAESVGQLDEYTSLFKFLSKFVHPTSWTVNGPAAEIQSMEYRNLLVISAQRYALDTLERVRLHYKMDLKLDSEVAQ